MGSGDDLSVGDPSEKRVSRPGGSLEFPDYRPKLVQVVTRKRRGNRRGRDDKGQFDLENWQFLQILSESADPTGINSRKTNSESVIDSPRPRIDGTLMTIVVQCSCGRKLRAPDQMAGRAANCVCGNSVPLIKEEGPRQFEEVQANLGEPVEGSLMPPVLARPQKTKKKPGESVFRGSRGRNVEAGEAEDAADLSPRKKKKRRQDKVTSAERKRSGRPESFFAGVGRSLKFPFRWESLLTILIMSIAYGMFTSVAGFMKYGVLGFKAAVIMGLGTLMILGYFLFFLLQIFRLAAVDEDDLPLTMEFDMDQIRQDLWLWIGALWWCGIPYLIFTFTLGRDPDLRYRMEIVGPVLGLCLFLFPMALMSTALHMSVLDANPLLVGHSIWKTAREYLATTTIFGAIIGLAAYLGLMIPPFPAVIPVLSQMGLWLVVFYALCATAYGYGNFYYRNRSRLGWFGELPKQI